MTIRKYEEGVELKEGQYVCFSPAMACCVCGHPRKVTSIRGKRIFFLDKHEEEPEGYKLLDSVVLVCDTKEEGMRAYESSRALMIRQEKANTLLNGIQSQERKYLIEALVTK